MGEKEHIFHQLGFLCVASVMHMHRVTACVLHEKSHLLGCYLGPITFIFSQTETNSCKWVK